MKSIQYSLWLIPQTLQFPHLNQLLIRSVPLAICLFGRGIDRVIVSMMTICPTFVDVGAPMKSELQLDADVFDAIDGPQVKTESKHVKVEKTEIKSEHIPTDGVSKILGIENCVYASAPKVVFFVHGSGSS